MLALFATEFPKELFVFLGLHWFFMSVWIFLMASFHQKYISKIFYRHFSLGDKLLRECREQAQTIGRIGL